MSAEQAREIVNRLLAIVPRRRLNQLFVHIDHSIHRHGREKIKQLLLALNRLEANPLNWPIPVSPRGRPDVTAGRIQTYLASVPGQRAHKQDIAAALNIRKTTAQTTLCSMVRAGRIDRIENGVYALEGVAAAYIPTDKAILDALDRAGQLSCAELRAETGKSEGAVHAALHRLHNARIIIRTERGKYARAGSAPPHVYTRDAISDPLRSGKKKKTIPELMAASGKNYGETYRRFDARKPRAACASFESRLAGSSSLFAPLAAPGDQQNDIRLNALKSFAFFCE